MGDDVFGDDDDASNKEGMRKWFEAVMMEQKKKAKVREEEMVMGEDVKGLYELLDETLEEIPEDTFRPMSPGDDGEYVFGDDALDDTIDEHYSSFVREIPKEEYAVDGSDEHRENEHKYELVSSKDMEDESLHHGVDSGEPKHGYYFASPGNVADSDDHGTEKTRKSSSKSSVVVANVVMGGPSTHQQGVSAQDNSSYSFGFDLPPPDLNHNRSSTVLLEHDNGVDEIYSHIIHDTADTATHNTRDTADTATSDSDIDYSYNFDDDDDDYMPKKNDLYDPFEDFGNDITDTYYHDNDRQMSSHQSRHGKGNYDKNTKGGRQRKRTLTLEVIEMGDANGSGTMWVEPVRRGGEN